MLKMEVVPGIELKLLEKHHGEPFFEFIEKGRADFENWIPFVSETTSLEKAVARIEVYLKLFVQGRGYFWCLWHRDRIIGLVLIKDIDRNALSAEIGYMIDPDFAEKGIISRSCRMMIGFLFDELQMNRIVICCDEENERSSGIAKRFGFECEGVLKQSIRINGTLRNTMVWGLMK